MSDPIHDNQDVPNDASETPAVDAGRRKLAGTALGVAAVFTLSSRPVWAHAGQQCTISGMMSGNLSAPKGQRCDGCTPGYWKQPQHLDSWAPTGFKTTDKFNTIFGVTQYVKRNGQPYTLLEVLQTLNGSGDPISTNLGFHAVAALLSAAHPNVNYGYTAGELITLFKNNYLSDPAKLKNSLAMLNERGCPLN